MDNIIHILKTLFLFPRIVIAINQTLHAKKKKKKKKNFVLLNYICVECTHWIVPLRWSRRRHGHPFKEEAEYLAIILKTCLVCRVHH